MNLLIDPEDGKADAVADRKLHRVSIGELVVDLRSWRSVRWPVRDLDRACAD